MERLKIEDILIPGAKIEVGRIDFDDPKNAHIKQLFADTRKRQEELEKLKEIDPSVWDLRITI